MADLNKTKSRVILDHSATSEWYVQPRVSWLREILSIEALGTMNGGKRLKAYQSWYMMLLPQATTLFRIPAGVLPDTRQNFSW